LSKLIIPGPGRFGSLHDHQQKAVTLWQENCERGLAGEQAQVGLWVYGDRGAGSTYIASTAAKRMVREIDDDFAWDYVTATNLMDRIRESWSANKVSQGNSGDYDLYVESASFEDAVRKLWDLKLLWIDDLYEEHDITFFRKHALPRLFQRVKSGLPTVIATDMPPGDPQLDGLEKVIQIWFVTCYAER
jgi:hypothetical protein